MGTPIGLKHRAVGSRWWTVRLWIGLVGVGSTVACHRPAADKAGEPAPSGAAVKQALDGLEGRLADLETRFGDLRKQIETVPPNLPGFSELRGKFYAIEEGRGITDEKVKLLSGRLDSALRSGKREEMRPIAKEIAETQDELNQLDQLHIALLHQVLAFQRLARRESDAAATSGSASPTAKARRSKSKP